MKSLLVSSALLLVACSTPPTEDNSSYGASVGIVNHTEKYIHSASVNGAGGANMGPWGAGAAEVCCASIPRKWHPGMQVVVRWDMPDGGKHIYKEKVVEVEKYEAGGSIYLHFFPDDKVRVVVSRYYGSSPKHPIPSPEQPISQPIQSK